MIPLRRGAKIVIIARTKLDLTALKADCPGLIRTPLTEAHFPRPKLLKDYLGTSR